MKKILLIIIVACISVSASAQKKKIAILETMCTDNSIGTGYLRMIGDNIETGIVNHPDYIAFNRKQVSAIMEEHKFQRSGLVDDAEIRAMGQMAGVDYVLASEAIQVDGNVFVTAKVLNVETGRYVMSANELMVYDPQKIQEGCSFLAAKLLNNGKDLKGNYKRPTSHTGKKRSNAIAAKTGLTAYWTFDDETGRDVTGNGYNGNKTGNISYITDTPDGEGKAIQFLGDGNSTRYFYTQERISTSIFSIAFWIKDFGTGNLFKLYKENDYFVNFCVDHSSRQFTIYSQKRQRGNSPQKKSYQFNVTATELLNSGWHHIVISVNDGYMQLYIDGELLAQGNGYCIEGNTPVYFGAGSPVMKLDNVRIYNNYILSSEEVKQIYNSEK